MKLGGHPGCAAGLPQSMATWSRPAPSPSGRPTDVPCWPLIDAGLLRRALVVARRGCTATPREGGDGPMQPPPPLSPETLAAQALGDVDPVSGGADAGDQPVHQLRAAAGRLLPAGPRLHARRQPDLRARRAPAGRAGRAGGACALFASGMAAATAIFQSLLPGDHVLVARVLYWGVRKWLAEFALTWGLDVEFVDTDRPRRGQRGHPSGPHAAAVAGDAGQPHLGDHRPRGACEHRPCRRRPGGRRQHRGHPGAHPTPSSWAPTWSSIPPPSTSTATATCWPVPW